LSIGRVQTPTLSLIVSRDLEIEHFVPKDFFAVVAQIEAGTAKTFDALWTPPDSHPALDSEKRCIDKAYAVRIAGRIKGEEGNLRSKRPTSPTRLPSMVPLQPHDGSLEKIRNVGQGRPRHRPKPLTKKTHDL
ncbi:DNA topoisomerase, type IA, central domain protein, partial [mine drainage metagenome]